MTSHSVPGTVYPHDEFEPAFRSSSDFLHEHTIGDYLPAGRIGIRILTLKQPLHILWVNIRLLHPLTGGDRIRTYKMLCELRRRHRITYLTFQTPSDLDTAATAAEKDYCQTVVTVPHKDTTRRTLHYYAAAIKSTLSHTPYIASKYKSAMMTKRLEQLVATYSPDLIVCDYLSPMINVLPANLKQTPLVIFQHNVESLIWKRHYETARPGLKSFIAYRQWQLTKNFEIRAGNAADGQITVSDDDAKWFHRKLGMTNILGAVPTGVDCKELQPRPHLREPHTIAFLGSMDWHANIDAVSWFVRKIYPAIKEQVPLIKLLVIGRNPSAAIRAFTHADSSIEITGTVDDIRPHIARASAMVLPLQVGGGTRIKVYEAMAMGVPVVSTRIGAEGLAGENGKHLLLADTPEDFARESLRLLQDDSLRQELSTNAREFVQEHYQWSSVTKQFETLFQRVIDARQDCVSNR